MAKLKNLEDLFHHQLRDIYNAEKQLIDALPKMVEEANDPPLKKALSEHLEETKNQAKRLEEIGQNLGVKVTGETCKAMKGLIREAKAFISEDANDRVRDAGIIADAQRIEHYEISAYGTAVEFAKALGKNDIANKLSQSLQEESNADRKLNDLAIDNINVKAKV